MKKYVIGGTIFLLCFCIGYFVTNTIKGEKVEVVANSGEPEKDIADSIVNDSTPAIVSTSPANEPTTPPAKPSVAIAKAEVQRIGDSYSLHITCQNVPVNVILRYEIPALKKNNLDGYFTRIPGTNSGSYKVNVTNSQTGEILASKTVSGFKIVEEVPVSVMTVGEFQALLLNQSDNSLLGGRHPKVSKSIALSFEGLQEGDKRPGDVLAVREKIAYGIWSSAKVLRVGYDENGKINSAKIQPIY